MSDGKRSARVLIHPRCLAGPARGALESCLQERGFDISQVAIGPEHGKKKTCDLVRMIERTDTEITLERFDGVRFTHPVAPPEPIRA